MPQFAPVICVWEVKMQKKREKTMNVMVVLTAKQLQSIFELHPNEISFTRQLVTWDLRGRKRVDFPAKRLEMEKDIVKVIPDDDSVPAFKLDMK